MSPTARLIAAACCFAAWLVLLLVGIVLGGAVHLLAATGVALAWLRTDSISAPREAR